MKRPVLEPGQEWVWDYPRPPRLERSGRLIRVVFGDIEVARTAHALRILETSHPPVYYIPSADVRMDLLRPASGSSFCEWKGVASYYDLAVNDRVSVKAAWTYRSPNATYARLRDAVAFYPSRVDACYVDDERVRPQEGDFYGGWITNDIAGPFKGAPGTRFW